MHALSTAGKIGDRYWTLKKRAVVDLVNSPGAAPGMGGSEGGDGKGAKGYGVTGMIDGPGSVSTLILVVVGSTEEGGGELLLPEEDMLAGLDVDVREEDNDAANVLTVGGTKEWAATMTTMGLGVSTGKTEALRRRGLQQPER